MNIIWIAELLLNVHLHYGIATFTQIQDLNIYSTIDCFYTVYWSDTIYFISKEIVISEM